MSFWFRLLEELITVDIQCVPAFILGIITIIIAGILSIMYPAWDSKNKDSNGRPNKPRHEKWFYAWLIGLSALGGFWALFLPLALNQKFDGPNADGNQLRLHLLYITGGVLALTTLGETHRKNTVDREKAKVEKDNYEKSQAHQVEILEEQQRQFNETIAKERERIEVDKDKNEQDHIRQVHAERRSRYTTAIEQLSSDKASIRLGGVYTLVGLVDEWLSDEKTTSSHEKRHKEGQVIINNLCAYIRSPLPLAERAEQLDKDYAKDLQNDFDGDIEKFDADKRAFARDKATLEEERQVRQSIIKEIRERIQDIDTPGSWSKFDYDFSNAHFFYPIVFTNSYFDASSRFFGATFTQDTDFSGTTFTERAPFSEATFTCTPFSGTTFTERAPFSGAIFTEGVDFSRVTFTQDADFSEATFTGRARFSGATFLQDANFSRAAFTRDANFFGAKFTEDANFNKATFTDYTDFHGAKFSSYANFSGAEFTKGVTFLWVEFTGDANFFGAKFTGDANFFGAEFTGDANFFEAEFTGDANFSGAKFTSAHFLKAKFTKKADFSEATFEDKPKFEYTLDNKTYKAKFSHRANPEDSNFKVSHNSPYKIETKEQEHNGIKFVIPEDAELFDPDEPSEQGNNDGS